MKGLFVTGTDTGVGKTIITATLIRLLRQRGVDAVALKPFATGLSDETDWRDNDPQILAAAMDQAEPAEVIAPVRLSPPLSPYDAARITGAAFDITAIIAAMRSVAERHEFVIVEGVGGVQVPLTEDVCVSQFARELKLPALLVARSRLGTVNHTLLSINALRQAGVSIEGVLYTRASSGELSLDERVGPETACRFAKIPCFGYVNRSQALEIAPSAEEAIAALPLEEPAIQSFAEHLLSQLF